MVGLILSFLISFAIGFFLVELLWPVGRLLKTPTLVKVCLAAPVGYGLTSCLLFLWMIVYGRVDRKYIVVEIVTLAVSAIGLFLMRRKFNTSRPSEDRDEKVRLRYDWLFPVAFYSTFLLTAIVITLSIIREPSGGWDAWAIFGVHARSIFRGGNNWREGFSQVIWWSHPDYPLLLPLSSVRTWLYAGHEIPFAQPIIGAVFTLSTLGLICSALSLLRSRAQAFLAGTVVLSFAMFTQYGSSAYADAPIMFFITATFVLFAQQHESGGNRFGYLILAGATAGLAAWTKNEGLLFVLTALVAHLLVTLRLQGWRVYLRQLGSISLGLLPVLAVVLYFKTRVAPPSELVAAMGSAALIGKILDYHRYVYIAHTFWVQIIDYDGRGVSLTYLLPIYLVCVGATLKHKAIVIQLSLTLCLMLAGYFWVYLTTPYDLAFHMRWSVDRLLLELWPGFLFVYFLIATTPEKAMMIAREAMPVASREYRAV